MFDYFDSVFVGLCLEGFLCGLYSGMFAIYLQGPPKESRTATIVFYVLCLLYVLSAAALVCDILDVILQLYLSSAMVTVSLQHELDMISMLVSRARLVQNTVNGCGDFIAQFILIYRCWIVWGKSIRVVIIPSFFAITFLATWLATDGAFIWDHGQYYVVPWGLTMTLTALASSMAVNTLVTGLIVFKIFKVFLEVKATSVERTLGPLSSNTRGTKLQHIIFIIVESGMALFAIQLVRIVITSLWAQEVQHWQTKTPTITLFIALNLVNGVHEMLNGIAPTIIFVRVSESIRLSFDDEESFKEAAGSLHFNNFSRDTNTLAFQRVELESTSCSMPPHGGNEDISISFYNSPSETNELRRVGSSSSLNTPLQRSETIDILAT